ncbi:MAG TPA: hypothetical protein VN844_18375 [Pyrinomonadaceae bacterium]|nr:hypothetical protein [Pyrinomonadaceae bacterium]
MRRLLWTLAGATFLLTALLGTGAAVLFRSATASAQNPQSNRVITSKRVRYPNFELNVLVDGRPLGEYSESGRVYVDAQQGAEYELRLRNPLPDRVAVALSVDGLNTIDADQTSAWNASKWVIEPYQTITITGWQMSSERARRFYFTTERDSYAAKLGRKANLGVITAVFFREKGQPIPITKGEVDTSGPIPSAEPQLRAEASRDSTARAGNSKAATGIGRSVRHDVRTVDMDLDSRPAAELTIRYQYARDYSRGGRYCPEP